MKYDAETTYDRAACPPSYFIITMLPSKMTPVKHLFHNLAGILTFSGRSGRQSAAPTLFEATAFRRSRSLTCEATWIRIWAIMPRATRLTANQ